MIFFVPDISVFEKVVDELSITLKNGPLTGTGWVLRFEPVSFVSPSPSVLFEFTDTVISVVHSSAFLTLLVNPTLRIEFIFRHTKRHRFIISHWSVTKMEAVATITPVISVVEFI